MRNVIVSDVAKWVNALLKGTDEPKILLYLNFVILFSIVLSLVSTERSSSVWYRKVLSLVSTELFVIMSHAWCKPLTCCINVVRRLEKQQQR